MRHNQMLFGLLLSVSLLLLAGCDWLPGLFPPPTSFTDDFDFDSGMWTYVKNAFNIDTGERHATSAYRDAINKYLVLTENRNYQAGIVWLNWDIFSPFTIEFRYKAGSGTGADGIVFMFYKKKDYEPYDGGALGFTAPPGGPYSPTAVLGYGIELDNWYNEGSYNDPSANHIALIKDHVNNHLKYVNDERTEDNEWHKVKVAVGVSTIGVYVDNSLAFAWEGQIDRTYGGLGFSATTGAANNWHIIDDVKIRLSEPARSTASEWRWPTNNPGVIQEYAGKKRHTRIDVRDWTIICPEGATGECSPELISQFH
jgi:hypothetical protein